MSDLPKEIDAEFIRSENPRTVYATVFSRKMVSTVRLIASFPVDGELHPFETLVFDQHGHEIDAAHYLTHQEAREGHWHFVEQYLQSQ
jgi:hypothetical protein